MEVFPPDFMMGRRVLHDATGTVFRTRDEPGEGITELEQGGYVRRQGFVLLSAEGIVIEGDGDLDGDTFDGVQYPGMDCALVLDCYECGARGFWHSRRWSAEAREALEAPTRGRVAQVDVSA